MQIQIDFLLAPGTGNNTDGKFYIGIRDDRCPFIIYGANTTSGGGTKKKHPNAASVASIVNKKQSAEYDAAHPGSINEAAKRTVLDLIEAAFPGLDVATATWAKDGITFGGNSAKTSTRPKRLKRNIHAWI